MDKKRMCDYKIIGVGIDSIEIQRFYDWQTFNKKQLLKVFTNNEIDYCLKFKQKLFEKLAARFAAKEAAYKALSTNISFIKFCKYVEIVKENNAPKLRINWEKLKINQPLTSFISITHTKSVATAIVIFQEKN